MNSAYSEDYEDQPKGLWGKVKEKMGWGDYEEEEDVEYIEDSSKKRPTLKVHSSRINRVSVWLTVETFDNAQQAADGLKAGHQQIVNLEKANLEVTTRVIDFLLGVTYALDGYMEKVGEKVYLFTPSNFVIEVESTKGPRKVLSPFHDN